MPIFVIIVIATLLNTTVAASETQTPSDPRVVEARSLVKEFAGQLMDRLQAGMKKGGPTAAIDVCNIAAPEIATTLSTMQGWDIGRTSLKTRNPDNRADTWELKVLQQFEQRREAGEDISTLEYHERTGIDGNITFRYMKAIPTKGLCLACHGSDLAGPVSQALAEHYPDDQATGFSVGDLRGAFSLVKEE